jgi:hypothetical protein
LDDAVEAVESTTVDVPQRKRRVDYTYSSANTERSSIITRPGDEGSLTEPLSCQWKFVLRVVESGLEGGLTADDATTRGVSALEELRRLAIDDKYDHRDQAMVKRLVVATCKSGGAETGVTLARRAVEAWQLVKGWKLEQWHGERERQLKGKPL